MKLAFPEPGTGGRQVTLQCRSIPLSIVDLRNSGPMGIFANFEHYDSLTVNKSH